jgi:neutral ceramidase
MFFRSVILAIGMLAVAMSPAAADDAVWKVGLARAKITPDQPVFMAGYASRNKPYDRIEEDLFAKVLVLEDASGAKAALITTDLIGFPAEISEPMCRQVAERTGIARERIIVNSSHTHAGPTLSLDPSPRDGRALADTERTVAYTKSLQDKIVKAAAEAAGNLQPARLSRGGGVVHFVMNRREFTERGIILGVNPRGLADRSVPILRIDGEDGQPLAVVFGAACHNTTLTGNNYEISGDYAGHAQRLIEEKLPGVQAMFLMGCGGDANPYPRGTHELAKQHGGELAAEVLRILETKFTPVHGPLRVAFGQVALPLASPPAKPELEKDAAGTGIRQFVAQRMLERLAKGEKLPTEYHTSIAVWQFGEDLTLVALPGEVVVDYVRLLEDALGPNRLWVSGYNHDVFGYLPSARVLREGGYETRGLIYGGVGYFAPEAEQAIVAKVRELASAAGRKQSPP